MKAMIIAVALMQSAAAQTNPASRPRVPVLAELFTSEGCSSCPPADELLRRLIEEQPIDGVEVVGISEHVDYWDRLGWKDPFSSSRFTIRQNAYARAFGTDGIYTPQFVVNGRVQVVGSDARAVRRALSDSARGVRAAVTVGGERSGDTGAVTVRVVVRGLPASAKKGGVVIVAVVEDDLVTDVARGENARKRLRHAAVARTLDTIGRIEAGGTAGEFSDQVTLDPGWRHERLRIVAFVQHPQNHVILGAASGVITP